MPYQSTLSLALLATSGFAAPSLRGPLASRQEGPDGCPSTSPDTGAPYLVDIGYYEDKDCTKKIKYWCIWGGVADTEGSYGCAAAGAPAVTPYYVKIEDTPHPQMQLVFTRDQSCPPNGPGAVFATTIDNGACVQMNLGGDTVGLSAFPQGGSGIARVAASGEDEPSGNDENAAFTFEKRFAHEKRDGKCDGFVVESQMPSYSQTVQISNIVGCTNGAEAGCQISIGQQHTESVSTSYSVSAGAGIEGIFSVETTFGQEYTESSTTTVEEGFSIPQGQKGYLSAYSAATLFKGKFTGCDSGDSEQEGQALVIKKEGFTYEVVLTGT